MLEEDLARRLSDAVKVRNLIGHAYAEVDPARLRAAAQALLPLLDRFCRGVLAYAEGRARERG